MALTLLEGDAAVVMTHSYEQDRSVLTNLLEKNIAYLGVLGPRYRTADLLRDVKADLAVYERSPSDENHCSVWNEVHSPVGLNLGGHSPATIALSILAEIQGVVSSRPSGRKQVPESSGDAHSLTITR